jgi:putative ABC transport system permease protein
MRKLFRSIVIVVAVTSATATLFSLTTIVTSVEKGLKKGITRLGADILVVPAEASIKVKSILLSGKPSVFYMDKTVQDRIRKIRGVKTVAGQTFLKTAEYEDCCEIFDMLLIAFDPENDFTLIPWLKKNLKRTLLPDEIIMGNTASEFTTLDNYIKLYGIRFKLAGVLEETGMEFIDNAAFIPLKALRMIVENSKQEDVKTVNLRNNQISTVLVQVESGTGPYSVAGLIEETLPEVKAIVSEQLITTVKQQMAWTLKCMFVVSISLWVMSLLIIGTIFSMGINERQRELGLLRSLGAKRRDLFRLIMTEVSMLSLSGGVGGILFSSLLLYIFNTYRDFFKLYLAWPSLIEMILMISLYLFLALATGVIAGAYPAMRSMTLQPYEVVRREQ